MKLQFKPNVYGFIYDDVHGDILSIINEPISDEAIKFHNKYSNDILFTHESLPEMAELFGIESEDDLKGYWEDILEVVPEIQP
jgi:hypothetical protein